MTWITLLIGCTAGALVGDVEIEDTGEQRETGDTGEETDPQDTADTAEPQGITYMRHDSLDMEATEDNYFDIAYTSDVSTLVSCDPSFTADVSTTDTHIHVDMRQWDAGWTTDLDSPSTVTSECVLVSSINSVPWTLVARRPGGM